jgi:hypothetical protein
VSDVGLLDWKDRINQIIWTPGLLCVAASLAYKNGTNHGRNDERLLANVVDIEASQDGHPSIKGIYLLLKRTLGTDNRWDGKMSLVHRKSTLPSKNHLPSCSKPSFLPL